MAKMHRLRKDAPEEIETRRLVLKRSVMGRDKPDLIAHIKEGGVVEFLRWSGLNVSEDNVDAMEREYDDFSFEWNGESSATISYTAFSKDDGAMLGYVALSETYDDGGLAAFMGLPVDREYAEVDWYLFGEFRGQGYAEEALRAIIARYFAGELFDDPMRTVNTMVGSHDVAVLEVVEDVGFKDPLALRGIEPDDEDEDDLDDPIGPLRMHALQAADFKVGA